MKRLNLLLVCVIAVLSTGCSNDEEPRENDAPKFYFTADGVCHKEGEITYSCNQIIDLFKGNAISHKGFVYVVMPDGTLKKPEVDYYGTSPFVMYWGDDGIYELCPDKGYRLKRSDYPHDEVTAEKFMQRMFGQNMRIVMITAEGYEYINYDTDRDEHYYHRTLFMPEQELAENLELCTADFYDLYPEAPVVDPSL